MDNLVPFPGERGRSGGPTSGGPDDPMLDYRVQRLEDDLRDVKASLRAIEATLAEMSSRLAGIDGRLTGLEGRLAGIDARISSVEARFQYIPTTWQVITIMATLLIGLSGVIFATGNYLRP